jgi:hypothetical protein
LLQSNALVSTTRPARYAAQLASHFGRNNEAAWEDPTGFVQFQSGGRCEMHAEDSGLRLNATAETEESLERTERVVKVHLERWGAPDNIAVHWQRP